LNFIQDILQHWKNDFINNKSLFWIEVVGTFCAMISSIILCIFSNHTNIIMVFLFYMVANICFGISAYRRKISWFIVLNIFYFLTNVIGLVLYFK